MIEKLKTRIGKLDPLQFLLYVGIILVGAVVIGFLVNATIQSMPDIIAGYGFHPDLALLLAPRSWVIGLGVEAVLGIIYFITTTLGGNSGRGLFAKDKDKAVLEGVLENSRYLTEKERDKYFPRFDSNTIGEVKKDGVPVRALLDKKGVLQGNFLPGVHSLVIGSTGSGKTTTFINPMIQLLASTAAGSSMIMTDPKGELFSLHSKYLKERGYDVRLLDLRDTYVSSRWNPLDSIWDMYQEYRHADDGLMAHTDSIDDYPDLKRKDDFDPKPGVSGMALPTRTRSAARTTFMSPSRRSMTRCMRI